MLALLIAFSGHIPEPPTFILEKTFSHTIVTICSPTKQNCLYNDLDLSLVQRVIHKRKIYELTYLEQLNLPIEEIPFNS